MESSTVLQLHINNSECQIGAITMICVENVPVIITESGEITLSTVEVHEISSAGIVLKIILQNPIDCIGNSANDYLLRIGKRDIYAYGILENFKILGFIQSDISFLKAESWEKILKDEANKATIVKGSTTEEKLLKELNEYFKSDKCTISYKDANKIEEIISNVLNEE